jgi:hypothetical protein
MRPLDTIGNYRRRALRQDRVAQCHQDLDQAIESLGAL